MIFINIFNLSVKSFATTVCWHVLEEGDGMKTQLIVAHHVHMTKQSCLSKAESTNLKGEDDKKKVPFELFISSSSA